MSSEINPFLLANAPGSSLFDPASPSAVRELLKEIGAQPNRTLGQNFLITPAILDKICDAGEVSADDSVLEIGPGLGALTCRLVRHAQQVVAVEKDPQMVQILGRYLPAPNLRVLTADALKISWDELGLPETNNKVVANLPYSVSKPVLRRLLEEWKHHFSSCTLLVQREVADRLVAKPATSAYGPMAIMAQLYGEPRRLFDVKPGAFIPAPEVTSSVVHVDILPAPRLEIQEKKFWQIVHAAFGQRRKQLGNTLRSLMSDKEALAQFLQNQNIDPQRRGETLSLEEFARLSNDWPS